MKPMIITRSTTTTATAASCLFFVFLSLYAFLPHDGSWRSWSYMWFIIRVVGVLLIAGLVVVLVRTTMVTWITVLVMLACAGKRRRILVVEGRKITGDVAMHLFKVVIKERSLVAVACATFLSSMAMVWVG